MSKVMEITETDPLVPQQGKASSKETSLTIESQLPTVTHLEPERLPTTVREKKPLAKKHPDETVVEGLKRLKQESPTFRTYFSNFCSFLLSTIYTTILLILMLALPVAMIVIGTIHLDDCPAEDMIPIYLIVFGAVAVLRDLVSIIDRHCRQEDRRSSLESVIDLFLLAWLVVGSVYVYRAHDVFQDNEDSPDYCNATVYWFAFWLNAAVLVCGFLGGLLFCGLACFCYVVAK